MWSCPNCRSKVDDSLEVCGSCGASRAGDEYPSLPDAGGVGSIPAVPGTDPVIEPQGDLRELVECYSTRDHTDAALMARYLEDRGIAVRLTREPRALTSQLMFEAGRVLIRPKDVPHASRLLRRIERRRARRGRLAARSAEYPWDGLAAIGALVLPICIVIGAMIGVKIGEWPDWDRQVCGIVGGVFGSIMGLSVIIWVFKLRKTSDAGARAEKDTVGAF